MAGRIQATTDEVVRRVVERVVSQVRGAAPSAPAAGSRESGEGVFATAEEAIAAASAAQKQFALRGLSDRRAAIETIRTICRDQAEPLGREEFEETKIGRLEHKIDKLRVVANRIPGVEWLTTRAFSGEDGIALEEYAPFGVIAAVTPVTHSLPTLACNAINMLAGGNAVVFNAHPSGARIAAKGTRLFNRSIRQAIGIDNLLAIVEKPSIESAQAMFDHRDVKLVCVTGGPALARAALRSPKRAIVAGPGNPPVVVDATADLDNAAKSIVIGASYDNNLLCIAEKEVFAVTEVFDELLSCLPRHKSVALNAAQVDKLAAAAFKPGDGGKLVVNKDLVGADAATLAAAFAATDRCRPLQQQLCDCLRPVELGDEPQPHALAAEDQAYAPWCCPTLHYADLWNQRLLVCLLTEGKDRPSVRHKNGVDLASDACHGSTDWALLSQAQLDPFRQDLSHGLSKRLNGRSRFQEEFQADVLAMAQARYAEPLVGQVLPGVISGVQSYGFFVEVPPSQVEGLVHVSSLKDDWYEYRSRQNRLVGRKNRRTYMVGDSVAVEIQKVDALRHQIDLAVIQPEEAEPGDQDPGEAADSLGRGDGRDGPESEDV